jgi:putative ABC transport system permease protein
VRATRISLAEVMKIGGRSSSAGPAGLTLRRSLVVTEVALSLVLVLGAFLFVRTLRNLMTLDAGFQRTGLVVASLDLTQLHLPADRRIEFKRNLLDRVRETPGVETAASLSIIPISGNRWNRILFIAQQRKKSTTLSRISSDYFRTMRIPVLRGRDFNSGDTHSAPAVAIVNRTFAERYFPGADAIGQRFRLSPDSKDPEFQIVGIVGDTKHVSLKEDFLPIAYFPSTQDAEPNEFDTFVIRSSGRLGDLLPAMRGTLGGLNAGINFQFSNFNAQIGDSLLRERLMASLGGLFGVLAAIIATIGVYGVISYMVARRTNEIGIRMAVGATPFDILRLVLTEAGTLVGVGVAVGVLLALGVGRVARGMLFGVSPNDPLMVFAAVAGLLMIGMAGSYVPARRASSLEPMAALRDQ